MNPHDVFSKVGFDVDREDILGHLNTEVGRLWAREDRGVQASVNARRRLGHVRRAFHRLSSLERLLRFLGTRSGAPDFFSHAAAWEVSCYQSGTVTVATRHAVLPATLHIGYVPGIQDETEAARARLATAHAVCDRINDGSCALFKQARFAPDSAHVVILDNGCEVTLSGPMTDNATPPMFGEWKYDESPEAKHFSHVLLRKLLEDPASINLYIMTGVE